MQRCGAAMQGRLGTVLAQVQHSVLAAAACSDGFLGGHTASDYVFGPGDTQCSMGETAKQH